MTDPATHAQRTERYNLQALYETSRLLSASLDLDFVLNNLLLTAMSKLLVTRGAVWLCDAEEEGAYRIAAKKGIGAADDLLRFDGAQHTGGMLYGADVPEALQALRVELAIPIWFGEREIGLVGLGKKATGQPYDERELEFIRSLVHMSASAVHNSLLVGELRQANRDLDAKIQELNTLFDLSQSFNASIERGRLVKLLSFALMGQMLVGKHLFMMRGVGADEDGGEAAFEVVTAKGLADAELEPDLIDALCGLDEPLLLERADEEVLLRWELFGKRGLVLALPAPAAGRDLRRALPRPEDDGPGLRRRRPRIPLRPRQPRPRLPPELVPRRGADREGAIRRRDAAGERDPAGPPPPDDPDPARHRGGRL